MLRNLYFLGLVFLFSSFSVYAQVGSGTLKGTLTDSETGEPLPFVNLVLLKGDRQVAGGSTNFDGEYTIKPIPPGSYNVSISFVGYNAKRINGVEINNSKITFLDVELDSGVKLDEFEVVEYTVPLIDKDGGSTGGTVTREDISKMPGRSATSIAATVGGVQETGDGISMRGAREGNTFYYIDGIKVRGSNNLPKAAIEEVQVLTGGIPANYGDATGGIIAITTRGASSEYFGSLDVITSGFANEDGDGIGLDRYAQTQIEAVISGPLLWKKDAEGNKTDPILGFFVSGNYRNSLDNRPSIRQFRIKESTRQQLLANPIDFQFSGVDVNPSGDQYIDENGVPQNSTTITPNVQGNPNAEFLRSDDWEEVPARQNDRLQGVSLTGKLDVATGPNIDLSFGGTFDWVEDNLYSYQNSLFNSGSNGRSTDQTWRAFGRFTQRFADDNQEADGLIKNAFYSVMIDYSQRRFKQQDPLHEDRLFNYGYVGKFETIETPNYTFDGDSLDAFVHSGFRTLETTFTPSETNPGLASYTTGLYEFYDQLGFNVRDGNDIDAANGLRNGRLPDDVYNLYRPLGAPFNSFQLFDQDQFRITASGNADVGDHAITIGFEFEQFTQRSFTVRSPVGLWNQARQLTNSHIEELDFNSTPSEQVINNQTYLTYDRLIDLGSQSNFDRNLRSTLGLNPNGDDYIYVDALDPDLFELDMFSADELLRQGNNALVNYYGFDYLGNRLSGGSPTIEDFFNATDEAGNRTRPVGAFDPIYASFYVMDKFAFDDIIFNVGLRVDRFDANQPTLKDQFVIGEAVTVGDARNFGGDENAYLQNQPNVVQDDWVVYVNDLQNPTAINGYRDGNTWFNSQGVEIPDPREGIFTPSGIAPLLFDPDAVGQNLTADAFRDYEPQWNFMPRIAFSFPISDEAVFFAHYDVLTQRPTGQNVFNPIDYLFVQNLGNTAIANPNLLPTTTIDYELGFQQVLSRSSSLKISAFYRETRDEIQARRLLGAYPVTFTTFDNFDFGTTKGMTLTYDLRRTGNVSLRAAYTLQFASATGSSSGSALNLVNSGEPNLRVIFPTDRDQRHVFITTFDYRYGSGKDYNGPVIGGSQILANTGLNIVGNLGSGTPYSRQRLATGAAFINPSGSPQLEGTVNGSRVPWQFRVNVQIDKSWALELGKGDKKKSAMLNAYLLINNIFDTQNILGVYRYTGNPDDDGYLAAPQFQPNIRTQLDETAFRQMYALKVANPFNYSAPRTIQLGIRLDF